VKHAKKPLNEKQLAANRANAQLSTGPRTPEGKAASARNAVRHGFLAHSFNVIRLESLDEVAHLKADLVAAYQPVNSQELFAIERMAIAQQSIIRAARIEAGFFNSALNDTLWDDGAAPGHYPHGRLYEDIRVERVQYRNYLAAEGLNIMSKQSNAWSLLLRYQVQAERLYRRGLEEFERLKALRSEMPVEEIANDIAPNEPEPTIEPLDRPRVTPSETNPPDPPPPPAEPSEPTPARPAPAAPASQPPKTDPPAPKPPLPVHSHAQKSTRNDP